MFHRTLAFALLFALLSPPAFGYERTWDILTTGNGHGFQTFDRASGRLNGFLEHPYRYTAPPDDGRDGGVGRRDLAHDLYFGVRVGARTTWLEALQAPSYEQQTHIITATARQDGVRVDVYYFAPFGFEGNGLLMLAKVTNESAGQAPISLFAKPNLKLGAGRVDPGDSGESISWEATATPPHGVETGPGGGHALYVPIGGFDGAACGGDGELYQAAQAGDLGDRAACTGDAQVLVLQKDLAVPQGSSAWWGEAVLFVNDDPREPQAPDFRDQRSPDDLIDAWRAFAGDKDAETLHSEALAEFEAWRVQHPVLDRLNDAEKHIWRQSEAVLRMGQVREPRQPNRRNRGMFLAALPIGEWHTGWVRDGVYASVAQAMAGHHAEARLGIGFYLGAEAGHFSGDRELGATSGRPYRVSSCRYYGNGKEEADFNYHGPNLETDGWGLVLWGAREYLSQSCDFAWLDEATPHGDTVLVALNEIAEDIVARISNDLPGPDCSIWEVHWDFRQVFTYTAAAQIRGLYDVAAIMEAYAARGGDEMWAARGVQYREQAERMHQTALRVLVNTQDHSLVSHQGVAGNQAVYRDGSTVEMLNWGLVPTDDPLYRGTLNELEHLRTRCGGYRRLEPGLSLVGDAGANLYDLSEWILLDLRIGDAWRRIGEAGQADALLSKITDLATANDNLIPELYEPERCSYTGVVPMVGYGAGAWQMSQLERQGYLPSRFDAGFDQCRTCESMCGERVCGDDGCGGECGTCADGTVCNAGGQCAAISAACGDGECAGDEDCATCPDDCGACCGNGVCEAALSEFCGSCPDDCGCADNQRCDQTARACADIEVVPPVGGGGGAGGGAGSGAGGGSQPGAAPVDWNDDKASLCAARPGRGGPVGGPGLVLGLLLMLSSRRRHGKGDPHAG